MDKSKKKFADFSEEEKKKFVRSQPVPCGGYADESLNEYVTDEQWDAYWEDK